jgi:hypothetical protein
MLLKIGERTYRSRTIQDMPMQVLLEAKRRYGWTVTRLTDAMKPFEQMQQSLVDDNSTDNAIAQLKSFLSDDEALEGFMMNIWMHRRSEGEDVTLEESSWFELTEITYIPEPGDRLMAEEAAADPQQARAGSARAAKRPQDHKKKSPSKTSKSPSTPTSPTSGK